MASHKATASLRYKLFDRLPSQTLKSLVDSIKHLPPESRVLDLGCGDGILEYLAGAERDYRFTSLDLEPEAIARVEKVFLSQGHRGDEAFIGDIADINQIPEITNKLYAICVSWRVLHGITPRKYNLIFKSIYQLLETDGSFIISVASDRDWKRHALKGAYNPKGMNDCKDVMFSDFGIDRTTPFPVHFFTLEELESLGKEHGFKILEHGYFQESSGYEHLSTKQNTYLFVRFYKH